MNLAEFRKNIWLHGSKLIFMVILGVYFMSLFMVYVMNSHEEFMTTAFLISMISFVLTNTLWGSLIASTSVISEVRNRTWIFQKMSALEALDMCFGKLFGTTFHHWCLGLFFALMALLFSFGTEDHDVNLQLLIMNMVVGTLLLQSMALNFSLLLIKRNQYKSDMGDLKSNQVIIALFVFFIIINSVLMIDDDTSFTWYGMRVKNDIFNLITLILFAGWSLLGFYRNMRDELQYQSKPNAWLAFNFFIVLFYSGFVFNHFEYEMSDFKTYFVISYIALGILTIVTLFLEPIDMMHYMRLYKDAKNRMFGKLYADMPLWIISLVFTIVISVFLSVVLWKNGAGDEALFFMLPVVALLFFLKSLLVNLALHLLQVKRPTLLWGAYMVIWYMLLPGILAAMDLEDLSMLFWPISPIVSGIAGIISLGVVSGLIISLIKKNQSILSKGINQGE
ncbi:MAG: hypothetical protein ACPG4Z_01390 [Chitinophagales bacterium]